MRSLIAKLLLLVMVAGLFPGMVLPGRVEAEGRQEAQVRRQKLHPELRKRVEEAKPDERLTVVIRAAERARLDAIRFRHEDVVAALKAAADKGQAPILNYLRARGAEVLSRFWLSNLVVARLDRSTLDGLLRLPEVEVLFDNFQVRAPAPERNAAAKGDGSLTWGLEKIQASRVWQELGTRGEGVRVAVLDTGVDIAHPDLEGKMHSDNPGDPSHPGGWAEFDFEGRQVRSNPHDTHGHGTHVSGTVLGGDASGTAIGVAPGATLMHGLVLPGGGGSFAQVIAGMQWAVEPTDADGNPAGQRAQIASMSWGAFGLRSEIVEPIRHMLAAGVMPVAAIGNCGDGCVGSPGAVFGAWGIGASDENDSIAEFSSGARIRKGEWNNPPDDWPEEFVKPDISAPGVSVLSALPGGGYERWSGTSMATPHVSGVAALMLAANPGLNPDQVLAALGETAAFDERHGPDRPNTRYGLGRIAAYEAVAAVAVGSGIAGIVTDLLRQIPLSQAIVSASPGDRTARTGEDGRFSLLLPPGLYTIKVERFGYEVAVVEGVLVPEDQMAPLAVGLQPLPTGILRGQVRFGQTGFGIPGARVGVTAVPIRIEAETGADGRYELHLPSGTYGLDVRAFSFTRAAAAELTVAANEVTEVDFALNTLPRMAVAGDVAGLLSRYLAMHGYVAESRTYREIIEQIDQYHAVIVNLVWDDEEWLFPSLVEAAHEAGVGLLFTKAWWYGWGIDMLNRFYGDPSYTDYWYAPNVSAAVMQPHPDILPGFGPGDRFLLMGDWPDFAWFYGYSGTVLAEVHGESMRGDPIGLSGPAIAVRENEKNRHALLASFGTLWWQGPERWTPEASSIFLNSLKWAARADGDGPKFVLWDLQVTPAVALWYQPVTVSVGIKNIGSAAGAAKVALSVGGDPAGAQMLDLAPDEHGYLHFTVNREAVGSYRVQIGHLTGSFRIRPPKVTVEARTVELPASGRGRNADPGEPAIPLAGAQVDLVKGGRVISRGRTDHEGRITFDSTASRDQYTLVVRHSNYGYNTKRHYLLAMPVSVEDDASFAFTPQAGDTAILDAVLSAQTVNHHGTLFLANQAFGRAAFELPSGQIAVTPGSWRIANVMAYDVPGAQWAYASEWQELQLSAGRQAYPFGGDLALKLKDVRGQEAPKTVLSWGLFDAYGREINAVFKVTAGAFGPVRTRIVGDTDTWPAVVAATAKEPVLPLLTLRNPQGTIEQTGYVPWKERPKQIALQTEQVMTGEYGLSMQFDSGPYMGMIKAEATLLLPARSASRTLLLPGDTFEVTVVFDAGKGGDIVLTETLPAGFSIVKQSSVPLASYADGAWTWRPSGRGSYREGQTIKVTYTVRVSSDVPTGYYGLAGSVTQNGAARKVAGPQVVQVTR